MDQRNSRGFRGMRLVPIAIALLVILFQFFNAEKYTNPETGKSTRVGLSEEQEEILGLQSYQQVLSQSRVINSGPQVDLVRKLAGRLAEATHDTKNKWDVTVVDEKVPNAFVLPGGKIVVFTGILDVAE